LRGGRALSALLPLSPGLRFLFMRRCACVAGADIHRSSPPLPLHCRLLASGAVASSLHRLRASVGTWRRRVADRAATQDNAGWTYNGKTVAFHFICSTGSGAARRRIQLGDISRRTAVHWDTGRTRPARALPYPPPFPAVLLTLTVWFGGWFNGRFGSVFTTCIPLFSFSVQRSAFRNMFEGALRVLRRFPFSLFIQQLASDVAP